MTEKMEMAMHEVSHIFLEGCNSLVAIGAITEENKEEILPIAQCLNS